MEVVYDTGSDWLVIEADDCKNCHGTRFHASKSSTFKTLTQDEGKREYGSALLKGYEA